jgi:hypothetical protein
MHSTAYVDPKALNVLAKWFAKEIKCSGKKTPIDI